MEVITKCLVIENEKFVLCKMKHEIRTVYVTIPYTEIDEQGKIKRVLNGFEMCVGDDIKQAVKLRKHSILIKRFVKKNPNHTEKDLINFIMKLEN